MYNDDSVQDQANDASTDKVVAFPSSADTQLQDISFLLGDAPVMQKQAPASASKTVGATTSIASEADFAQAEDKKPFARRVGPKTMFSAGLAAIILLPMSVMFLGGGKSKTADSQTVAPAEDADAAGYVSPEEYAAQQAELEQLRAQQAFTSQQVDADAIDAAGQQQLSEENAKSEESTSPETKPAAAPAATPTPPPPRATTISSRPAPRPAPSSAPAPQPTTIVAVPARSTSFTQSVSARPVEPVDPFERRAQLQAMGSYGAPPPSQATGSSRLAKAASNPFATDDYYVQTIAWEAAPAPTQPTASRPVERPLTEDQLAYQDDAAAVLSVETSSEADVQAAPEAESAPVRVDEDLSATIDPRRMSRQEEATATTSSNRSAAPAGPMAIMPGTNVSAELPYGFSWRDGTPAPEVVLLTTEDIMAGGIVAIPARTQFLAQAQIDPTSGAVNIQVVGLFGEAQNIQIPRASVIVQARNGSMLMAEASGGPSTPGPNVGSFLVEALGNGLGNVIDSDDGLITDIAGGVAETVIDDQLERSEAGAARRASRSSAQPIVWTLDPGPVQLTFNNLIPLSQAQR